MNEVGNIFDTGVGTSREMVGNMIVSLNVATKLEAILGVGCSAKIIITQSYTVGEKQHPTEHVATQCQTFQDRCLIAATDKKTVGIERIAKTCVNALFDTINRRCTELQSEMSAQWHFVLHTQCRTVQLTSDGVACHHLDAIPVIKILPPTQHGE